MNHMWQLWAVVAVLCLIMELTSGDFFIVCFSIGAVFSIIGALAGLNIYWQIVLFVAFSLLAIFTVRPVAIRYLHKNEPNKPSNADALLGRKGRVTEAIPAGGSGYVQIDGDQWKAVSPSGRNVPVGTTVHVVGRKSTIVEVEES